MTTVALYALADSYRALLQTLADGDFDLATIEDTIEASGIKDDIAIKAHGIECVARALEQYSPYRRLEIARLQALDAADLKKAQGLREYLKTNMLACGISKIDTPLFKISIRNNPEAVDIFDLLQVPSEYMRQPETPPAVPDKAAIKTFLKIGGDVPGARLVQGQRLDIK